MCFGWAGAYHRSVEDWSSSVWTGKKDGFELQDDTSFSWESAGFLVVAGLAKERHGHEHGRNSMTPWAIGHHIGCFIIRKSGKKQLFLWPQAVKAKDYGEIRRRFVFFSLVLPLASMVFFSNPELGGGKSVPRSRTFQKWNDDLDPEIGRWATWLRKLRRLRWGLGFTKQTSLMTICQSCQLHLHLRNSLKLTEIHAMHLWREKPVAAVCTWHGWRLCDDFSQKIHKSIEWLTGPLLWPPFFHCSKRLGAEDW